MKVLCWTDDQEASRRSISSLRDSEAETFDRLFSDVSFAA
jgi:hypothetical protein